MNLDETSFDASTFAKNKERLLAADVARRFFEGVVRQARGAHLLSAEHFTVDGTLIEAYASLKSVRPRDERPSDRPPPDDPGNASVNFRGERRTNATHGSTTIRRRNWRARASARRRSSATRPTSSWRTAMACVWISAWRPRIRRPSVLKRCGCCAGCAGAAFGRRRWAAIRLTRRPRGWVGAAHHPHVAQYAAGNHRGSQIDARTTRHAGYGVSQRIRKRVEEIFGWMKTVGGLRKSRYRGKRRTGLWAYCVATAYNLLRIAKLLPTPG
jgi:hypothetical protein